MRTSLLLLVLALPSFGAITVACDTNDSRCPDGTAIAITTVEGGPSAPGFKVIIGGSGSYTIANNNCFSNWNSNATTGTAPAEIYVWYKLSSNTLTPQSRSCALQFDTGVTLTINETVVARGPLPFISSPNRVAGGSSGCTQGQAGEMYAAVCTTADPRPGGDRAGWPVAVGDTFTDPNFGGVFTRLTVGTMIHGYFNIGTITVDNEYFVARNITTSDTRFCRVDGGGCSDYDALNADCTNGSVRLSVLNPGRFWCVPGTNATIKQFHLGTAPSIVSDGVIYTDPVGNITDGGTGKPDQSDWMVYFNSSCSTTCGMGAHVIAINLNNPSELAEYELADLPNPITQWDYFQITPGADPDGWRYVFGNGDRLVMWKFKTGDSTLTLAQNGWCGWEPVPRNNTTADTFLRVGCPDAYILPGAHADVFEVSGQQFRITSSTTRQTPGFQYLAGIMQASEGVDANLPMELGGGLQFRTVQGSDPGCAVLAPICVFQTTGSAKTSYLISGSPSCVMTTCTVTTTAAHGFSTSNEVLIGSVGGCTGINGSQTITATPTSTTFEFTGSITGTCSSNTGAVTLDTTWSGENAQNNDITAVRWLTPYIVHVRRLAKTNTVVYSNTRQNGSGYWDRPHTMVSPDGSIAITGANGGVPNDFASYAIPTGFEDIDYDTPSRCFDNTHCLTVSPADGQINVAVDAPNTEDCVVSAYTAFNFSPNTAASANVTLSGGAGSRNGAITSLTNGTQYWVTAQCDNYWFAAMSSPTVPVETTVAIPGGFSAPGGSTTN